MSHILDRPVWSALTTRQASLAEGDALARRYPPSIVPFAATADESDASLAALARLAAASGEMLLAQVPTIVVPKGCAVVSEATAVQMVARPELAQVNDPRIERLGEVDAAEMLELATLTRPGPFTLRAQALGVFWGVRIGGRLAAMAGERMKQDGYTEVSGVCTHPEFRGRGLGRLMSLWVANLAAARGEIPYLHTYANNEAAIRLYESIGFELRASMNVAVIRAV